MLFINAFLAAATFAIATALPNGNNRVGYLDLCRDAHYYNCKEVRYEQDRCTTLSGLGIDDHVTSFNTRDYGCEFYHDKSCIPQHGTFAHRGAIGDVRTVEAYKALHDAISSFRCGT